MNILAFDTCFDKTYIVLKKDNEVLENKIIESDSSNYHSVYLIPEIRNILKSNSLSIQDINVIGVNEGPGSFTGIRVGITVARVLAQQADIKLVGVNSLELLQKLSSNPLNTVCVLDARKNKVYYYENSFVLPELRDKDSLLNLKNQNKIIITDNSIYEYLKENNTESTLYTQNDSQLGLYLAQLTEEKLRNEKDNEFYWAKLKPLYIQPPSITKKKEVNS